MLMILLPTLWLSALTAAGGSVEQADTPSLRATLREISGREDERVPVTVSLGIPQGFTQGALVPRIGGHLVPAQVDVRATHEDGSARHALVSFELPIVLGGLKIPLEFVADRSPELPPFDPHVRGEDLRTQIAFSSWGEKYSATVEGGELIEASADGQEPDGWRRIVQGPRFAEYEQRVRPVDREGQPHPFVELILRVQLHTAWPGARIEVVFENCGTPTKDRDADFRFDDVPLRRVRVAVGANRIELYTASALELYDRARFRIVGWSGRVAPEFLCRQHLGELSDAGFVPTYNPQFSISDQVAQGLAQRWSREDPLTLKMIGGTPLTSTPVSHHMPGTGDRPDIGPYAGWHVLALNSLSRDAHRLCTAGDGNGLGSFAIHERTPEGGGPGVRFDLPGRKQAKGFRPRKSNPHRDDKMHTPSTAYVSYLLTGETYFAEEMSYWACYAVNGWPGDGLLRDEGGRRGAWQLRNLVDAAFLLPDDHIHKRYFKERTEASLERWFPDSLLATDPPLHLPMSGRYQISGRQNWVCSLRFSPWQYAWFLWSLHNAGLKGFPRALHGRDWSSQLLIGLYTDTKPFRAPDGKVYQFDARHAMSYSLPTVLVKPVTTGKRAFRDYEVVRPIESFGEMYYYLLVNRANAFLPRDGKPPSIPSDPAPENWRIRSTVDLGPGKWHDYGNDVCAPTLADVGLPGAQRMWNFVDRWMRNNPRKGGVVPGFRVLPRSRR